MPGAGLAGVAGGGGGGGRPPAAAGGGAAALPPTWNVAVFVAALPSASAELTVKERVPAVDMSMALPVATGPEQVFTAERSSGSLHA